MLFVILRLTWAQSVSSAYINFDVNFNGAGAATNEEEEYTETETEAEAPYHNGECDCKVYKCGTYDLALVHE